MKRNKKIQETYKKIKELNEGAYGQVILVRSNINKQNLYVMKTISIENLDQNQKKKTMEEVKIIQKLNHPNIIKFHEVFISKQPYETLNIIQEYADGGDLSERIEKMKNKNKFFSENQILDWFTEISLALNHMHSKHILHRDIKSQNVFLTKNNMIKLGDFGISKTLDYTLAKAMTVIGTPYYLSPEIIQSIPYSYESDIWSLGVLLYEMCSLKMPFNASNLPVLALKIQKGEYEKLDKMWSKDLRNLVYSMLQVDYQKRPSLKDILSKFFYSFIFFFLNFRNANFEK